MSSTNVHSQQNHNKYCAVAQIIPTTPEKGLEIPPKNAKPGPTRDSIRNEEFVLEISGVGQYTLQKDGTVVDISSKEKIGKVSIKESQENKNIRTKRAPSKYAAKEDKGMEL